VFIENFINFCLLL